MTEDVRFVGGNACERTRWADFGDAAFIAVFAQMPTHLKEQRAVAEGGAAFHAFPAADAFVFIDFVFKIRVFHIGADDGVRRAAQILTGGVEFDSLVLVITAAKQAIAARCVLMDAFDGGAWQHAFRLAFAALDAFVRIDLPIVSRLLLFAEELKAIFPGQEIYIDHLSLSVSCHIGPGSLAVCLCKKLEY